MSEPKPENVFTPRDADVNQQMYVHRPELEQKLKDALRTPKHVIVHGESGCGKTWLYKKVLNEINAVYEVANMGLCATCGSVNAALAQAFSNGANTTPKEKKGKRKLQIGLPGVAAFTAESETTGNHASNDFYWALYHLRERAGDKFACLVFDNLEHILADEKLVRELGGLILLVDDQKYASFGVRIILVGTSNEIRSFIAKSHFSSTIVNRLHEIPEVARLTERQSKWFVERGFFELLGCDLSEVDVFNRSTFFRRLHWFTDGIPQFLQELALTVAMEAERNEWMLTNEGFFEGLRDWIISGLVEDVARVEAHFGATNSRLTRKNQVIFCLGACPRYEFNRTDVERVYLEQFPDARISSGAISQVLGGLATGDNAILRKAPSSGAFRFVDPKLRIVARWLLQKNDSTGLIEQRSFDEAILHYTPKTFTSVPASKEARQTMPKRFRVSNVSGRLVLVGPGDKVLNGFSLIELGFNSRYFVWLEMGIAENITQSPEPLTRFVVMERGDLSCVTFGSIPEVRRYLRERGELLPKMLGAEEFLQKQRDQ